VIFTQNGSRVSGEIHYSDGGTGTVTGIVTGKRLQFTFSDSSGRSGSGWLEQSWNLFLGGPWHNSQGARWFVDVDARRRKMVFRRKPQPRSHRNT
jgi:hypothetical protein